MVNDTCPCLAGNGCAYLTMNRERCQNTVRLAKLGIETNTTTLRTTAKSCSMYMPDRRGGKKVKYTHYFISCNVT